jgi:hypothetical protein
MTGARVRKNRMSEYHSSTLRISHFLHSSTPVVNKKTLLRDAEGRDVLTPRVGGEAFSLLHQSQNRWVQRTGICRQKRLGHRM